jgi:hypothetical protein
LFSCFLLSAIPLSALGRVLPALRFFFNESCRRYRIYQLSAKALFHTEKKVKELKKKCYFTAGTDKNGISIFT